MTGWRAGWRGKPSGRARQPTEGVSAPTRQVLTTWVSKTLHPLPILTAGNRTDLAARAPHDMTVALAQVFKRGAQETVACRELPGRA